MRSGYFESNLTGYDDMGLPIFDRAEDDEFFTQLWRYLIKNGVMSEPADSMMVVPGNCLCMDHRFLSGSRNQKKAPTS